jgi:hypothetical protein
MPPRRGKGEKRKNDDEELSGKSLSEEDWASPEEWRPAPRHRSKRHEASGAVLVRGEGETRPGEFEISEPTGE